jgi:SecD/SecF fusion protein
VLTCIILYWVGSEEIKGFGLTLGIGVVLNLFTAYFVTRIFFEMMSLQSIPREVWRYPLLAAAGIAAVGGVLWGGGYMLNDESRRAESVMILFGEALMEIAPAVVGLMLLIIIIRAVHGSRLGRGNSRVPMMHLVGVPNVGWTRLKFVFLGGSLVLTLGGIFLFFNLSQDDLYDIEFLGGTAAQIDLKETGSLEQGQIAERLDRSGASLIEYARGIRQATVAGGAGAFTLSNIGMPASRLEPVIKSVMDTADNRALNEIDGVRYSEPGSREVTIRTRTDANVSPEDMKAYLESFARRMERAAAAIEDAQVQAVAGVGGESEKGKSFEIVTLESNKDIVVGAIMESLQDDLDTQPALTFELLDDASSGGAPYFAISEENPRRLGLPITEQELAQLDLAGWKGGVAIVLDQLAPPQPIDVLKDRLRAMRLQPGFESHGWRESEVFGLAPAAPGSDRYRRVLVVVADENFPLLDDQGAVASAWVSELAEPEVKLLEEALKRQTSLSQVTQFDQQVSGEAKASALIAIVLSWLAIILYVWFRFGSVRWGLAAVAALIHDVAIAIGAIAVCHYVSDSVFGRALLLENFRVDLALVAALLTVVGYSVNDTIIVFDRIRENRGRLHEVTPQMVDQSVNQTLARTVLTSFSTLLTLIAMYIVGGPGIHGFSFVMVIGILTGTYSSFAIAAQILVGRKARVAAQVA